jgi:hypothetical protein
VACAACRREASAFDPALLFASMPAEDVSPADAARILAAVRTGIAMKAAEKRIGSLPRVSPLPRLSGTAAAVAAAVLIVWTSGPGAALRSTSDPDPSGRPGPGAARDDRALSLPASVSKALPFAPAAGPGQRLDEPDGAGKGNLPADATIYDWNPGGGQPRVVWIVDRSLDI